MWDNLTYADIQQAKEQVRASRAAVLQRHSEELEALSAEEAELDTLYRLVGEFARKFAQSATRAPAAAALPETQDAPPPAVPAAPKAMPMATDTTPIEAVPEPPRAPPPHRHTKPRHVEERDYGHTNFDSFNRALAKSL